MVFGVGAETGTDGPSGFNGGTVDDQGNYTPPAPRTPGQVMTNPAEQPLSWNTNDTPVRFTEPTRVSGGQYPAYTNIPFYQALRYSNELRGRGRGSGSSEYDDFVAKLRIYSKSKLGTDAAVDDAWSRLLNDSQQSGTPAMTLLNSVLLPDGSVPEGAGPRGPGAYTGPRTTVSMASERDLRFTADTVASTVLGRGVTDEEFQSVLEKVRKAEQAEPTITTTTGGMTTTQSGLTAEGRQNIITEALMQGPEAEDFGKATKMMDLFYSALEARPSGA